MSDEKTDDITEAVESLGLLSDPIDEEAIETVRWPQLDVHSSLVSGNKQ